MACRVGAPHRPRLHAACRRTRAATRSSPSRRSRPPPRRASPSSTPRARTATARRARPQRAAAGPRSPRLRRGRERADRDEGRHGAHRRRVDPGRSREGDPRRLRGEPRRSGRPGDRPLPHPRARSAHAVANLGARAGPARRRGPRAARRARERQPPPAGRGARARPVAAVQVALSPFDDRALRGGVVERCAEAGHRRDRPLSARRAATRGRPRSSTRRWPRSRSARGATPAEVALAWLLELSPAVVAIPGARRPETARSAARAATLELDADDRAALDRAFGGARPARASDAPAPDDADVVLVMGIPGAGKSRVAEEYVARGYLRLNRDERGGSLRELADALDEDLSSGMRRVVLDNTYLTRASRSYVIETASRHGLPTRCIWLDTPLAQAQVNLVERLLERFGSLPTPERAAGAGEARAGRARADLPDARVPRARAAVRGRGVRRRGAGAVRAHAACRAGRAGVFVAAAALTADGWERALERGRPRARLTSSSTGARTADPDALAAAAARLSAGVSGPVESALCPHAARPAELLVPAAASRAAARVRASPRRRPVALDLVGTGPAHRTLATTLGARYVQPA